LHVLRTPLIDVASLKRILAEPLVLIDCRFDLSAPEQGRQAYLRSHIPQARYLDLNQDLAGPVTAESGRHPLPEPQRLRQRLHALGVRPGVPVVVYDAANGSVAARAWWLLRWLGVAGAAVLDGGFAAWLSAGGELESGLPADPPESLADLAAPGTAATRDDAVATVSEVRQAMADPARRVVDARAAERYAGTSEPIDPVAGHVPGALNHPFADNLTPQGQFLPSAELHRRWTATLDGRNPGDLILMCGSGVTACHNLLALELAGLPGAKLYAGSWSEWIRDPDRPVARGSAP
jgi:thiosulfate/3-mercaptopyruvate sulfurtransferase